MSGNMIEVKWPGWLLAFGAENNRDWIPIGRADADERRKLAISQSGLCVCWDITAVDSHTIRESRILASGG